MCASARVCETHLFSRKKLLSIFFERARMKNGLVVAKKRKYFVFTFHLHEVEQNVDQFLS